MKTIVDFLKNKGILEEGFTKWLVKFPDGKQFDIVELIDEYSKYKLNGVYYRIYSEVNLADTMRDPDEIETMELGYRSELENAKLLAEDYIKSRFFHKNTKLCEKKNGLWSATDFCGYGATIIIKPITIL